MENYNCPKCGEELEATYRNGENVFQCPKCDYYRTDIASFKMFVEGTYPHQPKENG